MHLLILGATGKSGAYGYQYALEQGKSLPAHCLVLLQIDMVISIS